MAYPLAILTPVIGLRSETFIRRHIQDLCPGGTVAIASWDGDEAPTWTVNCPRLTLSHRSRLQQLAIRSKWRSQSAVDAERIVRFLKRHDVEVVLGEYLHFCLPFIEPIRKAGIRFFAHGHGFDVSAFLTHEQNRAAYARTLPKADGVIVVSRFSRERLIRLGLRPDLVHVVPCGTDVPASPLSQSPGPEVRCLAVGRMVPKKAPILLLDAFRRAAEQVPNLRLDVIGAGDLLPAARQYVRAFSLERHVTLHGGVAHEQVQAFLQKADLFLQHSMTDPDSGDEEGLPVGIIEAMAVALPVVSTRHAGIPEAVVEGETGLLVAEGDSAAMAEQIVRLARDPALRTQMGLAGWKRCGELFSWTRERGDLLRIMGLGG